MSKKFQPKDQFLQHLVNDFEDSLKNNSSLFFSEDELEKIVDYYETVPDYSTALVAVNQAIDLFPYSGALYIKKTQLLIYVKNYNEAWDTIEKATIYEPMSAELMLIKADLFTAEGEFEEAIEHLDQLYKMVDEDEKVDVLLEIADVYEVANNSFELGKVLKEVLVTFPSNEEALHRYWNYVIDFEEYDDGVEFFKTVISTRPYNFLAWYYLAKSYEEVGLNELAIEAYEYTLAINDYYFAYWDYAICLQNTGLFDKAISTYYEMLELYDKEDNIYFEIGHSFVNKNEYIDARKAYTSILNSTTEIGTKAHAHYFIAKSYQDEKQYDLAIQQVKKAIELKSRKLKYVNLLAKLYLLVENNETAATTYIQSLAIDDTQPRAWLKLAKSYHLLGLNNLVFETLKKAIVLLPLHAKLRYHYAAYLLHYGHEQNGLLILEQALSLDSTKKNSIFALFAELENNHTVLELINQFEN